jgi:hypothetical protein
VPLDAPPAAGDADDGLRHHVARLSLARSKRRGGRRSGDTGPRHSGDTRRGASRSSGGGDEVPPSDVVDPQDADGSAELKRSAQSMTQHQRAPKWSSTKRELPYRRIAESRSGPMIGDFGLLQVLGVGQSGKVVLARRNDQSARPFALKMMRKSDVIAKKQVARVHTERRVLGMIDSPFITRLHYSFQVRREKRAPNDVRANPPRPRRARTFSSRLMYASYSGVAVCR